MCRNIYTSHNLEFANLIQLYRIYLLSSIIRNNISKFILREIIILERNGRANKSTKDDDRWRSLLKIYLRSSPGINTENSIRFIGDVIASVTVAVSQTFHCITAEQRDNNFNVRVLAVSVPSIPFAWRFIIRVAATYLADRCAQFLWSGIENEKEIAIVSKDKLFTSESCDSDSVWCPLRVVNHRFPNFERMFYKNTVNERRD